MALVTYERDGEIATITLNRPDKLNAFSDELVGALGEELHRFDMDDQAHVAILCGNGRAFSSGADVKQRQLRSREEFLRLGGPQGRGTHSSDLLTKAVNWKPVIAAPHGYVLGLSVGIVLECDLIVAEEGTRFQVTETSRGLGASKSRYLIERIEATPNIDLMFNTEVVGLEGEQGLERVRWRSRLSGEDSSAEIRNLFLFVGADPATGWLDGCGVTVDRGGFVVTGAQSEQNLGRPVPTLETSVPGVFAVGDVRSGSVKRVGGAIGEGAQVVAALHGFLGDAAKPAL